MALLTSFPQSIYSAQHTNLPFESKGCLAIGRELYIPCCATMIDLPIYIAVALAIVLVIAIG